MKHIVIDAREWGTSTGRYISNLVFNLEEIDKQHKYSVLVRPEIIHTIRSIPDNFSFVVCPYDEFGFSEQLGFKNQLKKLNADVVHFGMIQQPVLYKGTTVTTVQDLTTTRFTNPSKNAVIFYIKQLVYKKVIRRIVKTSSMIIVPTFFVKQDLVEYTGVDPNKIEVTYDGADAIVDTPKSIAELEGKKYIMYVGRPMPHKNLERLIKAFTLLKDKHPDLYLALAGKKDTNYRKIEKKVITDRVEDVVFTDFVSEGELRWLYQNCEAYIFPSLSEGFGLPGLEAMVEGAPVVSSNATCLPEVYEDAAEYFDPYNYEDMANVIDKVLTTDTLRSALIKKGKLQVAKYSWRRMAEQTLDVYKKVLGET